MGKCVFFQVGLIQFKLINCPTAIYTHLKGYEILDNLTKIDFEILLKGSVHIPFHAFQYILRDKIQAYFKKNGNGFIIHSSAIEINGKVHIFLGDNDAGKSTISKYLGEKYNKIADDVGIIFFDKDKFKYTSAPFLQKNRIKVNKTLLLISSVNFLSKGKDFSRTSIGIVESLELIAKQLWTNNAEKRMQLELLIRFISMVQKKYNLTFALNKRETVGGFISNYVPRRLQRSMCDGDRKDAD